MKDTRNRHRQNNWLTPFEGTGGLGNFFDDFWNFPSVFDQPRWGLQMQEGNFLPSIDVSENEKEFEITADLPGFDPKNINVDIEDDGLAISGKHESENKEEDKNYLRCERQSGSFYRKIGLPSSAELLKTKCTSKNGVLHITVPKKEENKKSKSVKIEVED
ncbi:Hsp20/alpha crystallin family protein [Candidatus Gracilibacteria bacterium]|nr:Hsp20/alpha crystallin family protein [Candidatus Gracilibacteria bacterium]MCF7819712.1 Hsp20/alpha crystallin family protein [Candidatus Gracilibacteria bacterium]